jgi:hypothetical protein
MHMPPKLQKAQQVTTMEELSRLHVQPEAFSVNSQQKVNADETAAEGKC